MNARVTTSGFAGGQSIAPSSKDRLITDFKAVVADTEALLKATANQSGEDLEAIRAKTRESLKRINDSLSQSQHALLARTRDAAKATDSYVHDHAWWVALAAAGSGALLGALLARR